MALVNKDMSVDLNCPHCGDRSPVTPEAVRDMLVAFSGYLSVALPELHRVSAPCVTAQVDNFIRDAKERG